MKLVYLFLFLILVCGCHTKGDAEDVQFIKIEHIGESDKPIFTIIFCHDKCKARASFERVITLDSSAFAAVRNYVEMNHTHKTKPDSNEFGVFRITMGNDKPTGFYALPSQDASISYMRKLKEALPMHYSEFHNALDNLLARLTI